MTTPSFRDVEQISALLDGGLSPQQAARLELRIAADPQLAALYRQLSQSRALLRKLPVRRAPRNFTLTPQMAGVKAPTPRSAPFFRLASAFASLLLVLTFAANGLGQMTASAPAAAPVYGRGGGPMEEPLELQAAALPPEETPLEAGDAAAEMPAVAAAPMFEAEPAQTDEFNAPAPQATAETLRALPPDPAGQDEAPLAKDWEAESQPTQSEPAPPRAASQVPGWLQAALLIIAILAGGAAWYSNWQANVRFTQAHKK